MMEEIMSGISIKQAESGAFLAPPFHLKKKGGQELCI